jgi:serine/threonine protein kinase
MRARERGRRCQTPRPADARRAWLATTSRWVWPALHGSPPPCETDGTESSGWAAMDACVDATALAVVAALDLGGGAGGNLGAGARATAVGGFGAIVHRDVRPESVLLDRLGFVKLSSFIYVKQLDADHPHTWTLCGTPEYIAPEVLLNKGHGKGVDWWTLGILTYEMVAGIDPFNDDDPMAIYQKILKGKIKFPKEFDK